MPLSGKLFVVSAPSGAGKTSLITDLIQRMPSKYSLERVVTYTTKQPREGEIHGRDYHFVTESDFLKKIDEGFFLEWSTEYQAWYGSPKDVIDEVAMGASKVLIVDRVGAEKIVSKVADVILIWISVSPNILRSRLQKRATENESQIMYRIDQGLKEIKKEDDDPLYKYHLVNDDFKKTIIELEKIVIKSCHEIS